MRRVQVNGFATLMDYCSPPSYASGGFIADSQLSNDVVVNGSQQQYLVRNSRHEPRRHRLVPLGPQRSRT
jgi:hypothetical protein